MESTFNIDLLPEEFKVNYLLHLPLEGLVKMYHTNKYYKRLLDEKYIIEELVKRRGVSFNVPVTTFHEFLTRVLWTMSPLEIFELYKENLPIRSYLDDLRIIAKFLSYTSSINYGLPTKFVELLGIIAKTCDKDLLYTINLIDDVYHSKIYYKISGKLVYFTFERVNGCRIGKITNIPIANLNDHISLYLIERLELDPREYAVLPKAQRVIKLKNLIISNLESGI